MRISIFGLGYVGSVTAGCLAKQGHKIIGVDVQSQKVDCLNRGAAPIFEPKLDILLGRANAKNLLSATKNAAEAVAASDLSIICVGTPPEPTRGLDLTFVRTVLR